MTRFLLRLSFLTLLPTATAAAQVAPELAAFCAKDAECTGADAAACEADRQGQLTASTGTGNAECLELNDAFLALAACLGGLTCDDFDDNTTCPSETAAFGELARDVGACFDGEQPPAPIAGWNCGRAFFDADDGCDCGCGVPDPDCNGSGVATAGQGVGVAGCEFCYDAAGDQLEGAAGECVADECAGNPDGERCEGSRRIVCSEGTVTVDDDCLTRGEVCLASGSSTSCVLADAACGPAGIGVCAGAEATICEGGQVSTTIDCATIGRVCGATPEGPIGCIVPGAGEGEGEGEEGEGEPECVEDSDCDDDEECDDGECERVGGRDRGDDVVEPAPLFPGCSSVTPGAAGALLLALVVTRRRRR